MNSRTTVTAYDYLADRRVSGMQAIEVLLGRHSKELQILDDPKYLRYVDLDEQSAAEARTYLQIEIEKLRQLRDGSTPPS